MQRLLPAFIGLAAVAAGIVLSGQQQTSSASADIARGTALYGERCASCHGQGTTAGGRGPALTGNRRLRGLPDSDVSNIVRNGTPNGMPPFALPADDLRALTTYLRSLNSSAFDAHPQGDAAAGERLFLGKSQCATCHIALGRGKAIGPDLSNIGRQLTLQELTTSLIDPSATIAAGYGSVHVRLRDGRTLQGFARNEGTYIIPLQTLDGRLVSIDKASATITRDTASVMPPLHGLS